MRVSVFPVVSVCVLCCGAGIAQAQVNVDVGKGHVGVEAQTARTMTGGAGQIVRSKDLTGLKVYNTNEESLGKIEDLAIDTRAGTIRYAVLSFGGVLGMGDKYFAVPWQKLSIVSKGETRSGTPKEDHCVLDVPKDTLKNAPGFDKNRWPNFADSTWRQTIDQYYGTGRQASGEHNLQR